MPNSELLEIEMRLLCLKYAHTRVQQKQRIRQLWLSIDQHGQRDPVIVLHISTESEHPFLLMDGYYRYWALKKLKAETIQAMVWPCTEQEGLLRVLLRQQSRSWLPFEESLLLHQLQRDYALSQEALAHHMGRTQSWVSRRLQLTVGLPDTLRTGLLEGRLSLWTTQRILWPMARAIPEHAEQLQSYLNTKEHSTREMEGFYAHYQKSSRAQKDKMVEQPEWFFKLQHVERAEKAACQLRAGPEGRWENLLYKIYGLLKELPPLLPFIFYEKQTSIEKKERLSVFKRVQQRFAAIDEQLEAFKKDG